MALTFINTSGLVSGFAHTFAANGDSLYVAAGVTWGSSDVGLWQSSRNNLDVVIAGDAVSGGDETIFSGNNPALTVTETGSITSLGRV